LRERGRTAFRIIDRKKGSPLKKLDTSLLRGFFCLFSPTKVKGDALVVPNNPQ
jgi:hypothetical protein